MSTHTPPDDPSSPIDPRNWYGPPQTPAPAAPTRSRQLGARSAALLAVAALLVGGAVGYLLPHRSSARSGKPQPVASPAGTVAARTITVNGTLEMKGLSRGGGAVMQGLTCYGTDGYSDISAGASVVIADDSGRTLTITHLDAGTPELEADRLTKCVFGFTATVPAGRGFYSITISHRGAVKFSEADMPSPDLSLGD